MFLTLILQYLNKLVERKIGDFASPQAFHTRKVQRLGSDRIKPFTQVGSDLVVPVLALVGDMPIQPRQLPNSTPPIVRTFHLSADCFVECSEFFQGVFQKFWRVFLFAIAKCQVGFHPEVYSYALTCSRTGFGCEVICDNVKPIGANTIPKDLDIAHFTLPLAVLVESEPTFIELQRFSGCVPRFEREANTSCFKEIRRLELRRTIAVFTFKLWKSTESIKEPVISDVDTDNHSIKGIPRYPCPLSMRAFEQLRQVRLQTIPTGVFPIDAVISLFQRKKVVMHLRKVIKHITEMHSLGVFAELELIRFAILFLFWFFHGVSRITPLTPFQWVGPTHNQAIVLKLSVQRDTSIKPQLTKNVKCFFSKKRHGLTHEGNLFSSPT